MSIKEGLIIKYTVGCYYVEFDGIGGWSIDIADAKVFSTTEEALEQVNNRHEPKDLLKIITINRNNDGSIDEIE